LEERPCAALFAHTDTREVNMGTRKERLRQAQEFLAEREVGMKRGPAPITRAAKGRLAEPITRATEGHLAAGERWGVATYVCIVLAAFGVLGVIGGLLLADPKAMMPCLGGAIFWGLLAWLNEVRRARRRRLGPRVRKGWGVATWICIVVGAIAALNAFTALPSLIGGELPESLALAVAGCFIVAILAGLGAWLIEARRRPREG